MTPLTVFGLAVVDSINPSALLVTIWLLTQRAHWSLNVTYLATVWLIYLSVGFVLMLGVDAGWSAVSEWLDHDIVYIVQVIIGVALLAYAILSPGQSEEGSFRPPEPRSLHWAAMIPLGITVTIMEIPTALPYFAAIGIMTTAELPFLQWAGYLIIYNLIFILPPAALFVVGRVAWSYLDRRLEGMEERLQRYARETLLWILGIVGFLLLGDALGNLYG